jgi:nicotinamide mononucleotide transporter
MIMIDWLKDNYIEIFGAVTGIVYVILEIRQNIWLWPVGIATSAVYVIVFFTNKFYADMSLQVYYLVISFVGWYWWSVGKRGESNEGKEVTSPLVVNFLKLRVGLILLLVFIVLYLVMYFGLSKLTDSPVPEWDSFITSLSIIATWMLARKILEHWYLWIIVNTVSVILFLTRGLYPTVILYLVYALMSFFGLVEWKKSIRAELTDNKHVE